MATNRRPLRRDRAAELAAYCTVFETGFDFFDDLAGLGIVDPVRVSPPEAREAARAKFMAAVEDAWGRLGKRHLASRVEVGGYGFNCAIPWALETFGEP